MINGNSTNDDDDDILGGVLQHGRPHGLHRAHEEAVVAPQLRCRVPERLPGAPQHGLFLRGDSNSD